MLNEKILLHYNHVIVYTNEDLNVIGANTSSTLRTVTAHNDTNCKYVRKFGLPYEITEVTDIEDPVDTDLTITVKALDGTTLGSRVGGGAFSSGSTVATAQGCYIEATTGAGGTGTLLTDIDITTDVDVGGKNFVLSGETIAISTTITFYLSATGSTYYDSNYMYGGGRHTPDGTEALPYFNITTALADLGGAFTIVTVLDSCTYDEELEIDGAYTLQSALGQTPTITSGIGARITREVSAQWNNLTACYFNSNGNDSTGLGTWQNPYKLPSTAITNRGSKSVIYGGININTNYVYEISTTITIDGGFTFESDYNNILYLKKISNIHIITLTDTNINIYGINIDSNYIGSSGIYCNNSMNTILNINDNTIFNIINTGDIYIDIPSTYTLEINIYRNNLRSSTTATANEIIYCYTNNGDLTANISKNICRSDNFVVPIFGTGIYCYINAASAKTATILIENNIVYNRSYGISSFAQLGSIIIRNNIIYAINDSGIYISNLGATNTISKNIIRYCGYGHYYDGGGAPLTITYISNYDNTNNGFNITLGTGCITTEQKFISIINYNFGLSSNSPCLKTDGAEGDIGAILRTILISSDDVVINGFNIDGQNQYNNAIVKTGASDYTGLQVKWCSIYDYQGIAIDDYSGTDTTTTISNCDISYNGNGIKFTRGGNTVEESLIYSNSVYGIHCDYTVNIFNHNVFYLNHYGLYLENNSSGITLKNSIISGNSLYGVYSEVNIIIIYCCITDAINSYVNISDSTNFSDNPLFINTNQGEEDFHIKTKELGYLINSACKLSADDGYDVGAYLVDYGFDSEKWEKFQLYNNPFSLDPDYVLKGRIDYDDAVGSMDKYGKGHRLTFPLIWEDNDDQTEEQIDILRYISSLVKTTENGLTENETDIRLHLLPSQKLYTGTDGVISATAKTLYNSGLSLVPNKYKGWHVGIKFEEGTSLVIDSSLKTATDGTKTWTVDEWEGYYLYRNYNYYLIKSNTATALTLSDVDDTLVNETIATYSLEKYFKILSHNKNTFYLRDDNSELIDGTYDYYIDFIVCKVDNNNFKPKMEGYYWQRQESKTGFQLLLEEK